MPLGQIHGTKQHDGSVGGCLIGVDLLYMGLSILIMLGVGARQTPGAGGLALDNFSQSTCGLSPSQVLVLLEPSLHIIRISLDPRCLCSDTINALGERHVEAFGALSLEERLDVLDVLTSCKGRGCDCNDGAHQRQTDRQPLLQLLPVVLDKLPECVTALRVSTQTRKGQVDILSLDVCAEREVECALNEFWRLGPSKCSESSVALETRLGIDGLVQDNLVLKTMC